MAAFSLREFMLWWKGDIAIGLRKTNSELNGPRPFGSSRVMPLVGHASFFVAFVGRLPRHSRHSDAKGVVAQTESGRKFHRPNFNRLLVAFATAADLKLRGAV